MKTLYALYVCSNNMINDDKFYKEDYILCVCRNYTYQMECFRMKTLYALYVCSNNMINDDKFYKED